MDQPPALRRKSRAAALLLSVFQPGFGHIYARSPRRAVLLLTISLVTAFGFLSGFVGRSLGTLLLVLLTVGVVFLTAVIDAPRQASIPRLGNPLYSRWYVVLPAAVVLQVLVLAALPRVQRLKSFYIPSASMEPTLLVGDRLVAALGTGATPARNSLVIFRAPDDPSVIRLDRVIGLPGDVIEVRDKQLLVNGRRAPEPWAVHRDPGTGSADSASLMRQRRDQLSPTAVPHGHVFVMGDNRDFSYDSRFIGPIPLDFVVGKPLYIYWSPDHTRLGRRLDHP